MVAAAVVAASKTACNLESCHKSCHKPRKLLKPKCEGEDLNLHGSYPTSTSSSETLPKTPISRSRDAQIRAESRTANPHSGDGPHNPVAAADWHDALAAALRARAKEIAATLPEHDDARERALVEALEEATVERRWDDVARLAGELAALRNFGGLTPP